MKKKFIIFSIIIIVLLLFLVIFKLWQKGNMNKFQIPVLMYHNIVLDENFHNQPDTVSVSMFDEQMKYLYDNNYKTLSMQEFYCWKIKKCSVPEKSVLITFDDGFYGIHYLGEPILKKYNFVASAFLIGSTIKETTNDYDPNKYGTIGLDIINSDNSSFEYYSHSYGMHKEIDGKKAIYKLSKEELDEDAKKMQEILHAEYISYPFNTDTDTFINILKNNGYKLAFRGESEKVTQEVNNYQVSRIGVKNDINQFKNIFETTGYNNRYGNGLLRKIFITIERKFKIKL